MAHQLGPSQGPLISEALCLASRTLACQACHFEHPGGALETGQVGLPSPPPAPCFGQVGVAVCCWPWLWAPPAPRGPAAGRRSPVPGACLPTRWASTAAPGRGAQPVLVPRGVCSWCHPDTCARALSLSFGEKRLIPAAACRGYVLCRTYLFSEKITCLQFKRCLVSSGFRH